MSSESWVSPQRSKTRAMSSSVETSQGSTNVEPIDAASGRTRFSMRLSTDEKPTSAPSACRARAMPQAIEWSFATPKMSAVFPSSSPIVRSFVFPIRCHHARPPPRQGRPARRPAGASEAFVLDADGVLILKGERDPGLERRAGAPRSPRHPVPGRDELLARPPEHARGPVRGGRDAHPGRSVHHRVVGRRGVHARRVPRPTALRPRRPRCAPRVRRAAPPDARRGRGRRPVGGRGGRHRRWRRRPLVSQPRYRVPPDPRRRRVPRDASQPVVADAAWADARCRRGRGRSRILDRAQGDGPRQAVAGRVPPGAGWPSRGPGPAGARRRRWPWSATTPTPTCVPPSGSACAGSSS